MASTGEGSVLPSASLQLLVPPVKIMSAFIWQVVQKHNVKQFDKLLDFISLVTEIIPELLNPSQTAELCVSLRVKLLLELCRSVGFSNLKLIQKHLDEICVSSVALPSDQMENVLRSSYGSFASMVHHIVNFPSEKESFFQEVYPEKYGTAYEKRLQQLVFLFLSRLEELLPVPNLQQTTSLLSETSASEEFRHHMSHPEALKTLLHHHKVLGTSCSAPSDNDEDTFPPTLVLPFHTGERHSEPHSDDSEEAPEYSEDDPASIPIAFCPPFAHHLKKKNVLDEQMAEQKKTSLIIGSKKTRTIGGKLAAGKEKKTREKPDRRREKKGKKPLEKEKGNKKPKESPPAAEDKRFLSSRSVGQDFPIEENRCSTCQKVFEHSNQLKAHLKIHSFNYQCSQCDKGFSSQSGYYQHQRLHRKGRRFICKHCNKTFLCNYSLKQHERLHDGPSNLCNVCGKNFSKAGFVRHMQMHRGEKNYLCTTCGKSFLSSGELLLHTRSHTGELPYTCQQCGKGFSCKSHLNVHTRSHTGERPYFCLECPKRFLTVNCLKRHMFSHSGVKPFRCSSCGKDFSQQGNLKRHMVVHKSGSQ